MPAQIKVSFAISGEKELLRVFSSIEKRAQGLASVEAKAARASESAAAKRASASIKASDKAAKAAEMSAAKQVKAEEAAARRIERIKERSATMAGRYAEKAAKAEEVAASKRDRANARAAAIAAKSRAGMAMAGVGAVGRAGRSTLGTVGGIAGGLGVTAGGFMISNAIMGAARLRHQASGIVQSTRDDKGKATQTVAGLTGGAKQMATTHGVDPSEYLGAIGTIAARAGGHKALTKDLMAQMNDLVKLSVAWGVSMEDMGGVVAASLDADIKPGKELYEVMEAFVAQGKMGSIEFGMLAQELAKIKGAAMQFDLSKGDMLRTGVALTQIAARAQVDPEQSRTSLRDLAADISMKGSYLRKSGVETTSNGKIRNPFELVADMIEMSETKGLYVPGERGRQKGVDARSKIFTGTSKAIVNPLAQIYREGLKDEKTGKMTIGKEAVLLALRQFGGAKLAEGETEAAYKDEMATEVRKANIEFQKLNSELGKLLPKVMELMPAFSKVVQAMAKLVTLAAENPFAALGSIFALHLGREIAAAQIGDLIKRLITSGAGGGGGGVPGGGGDKVTGALVAGAAGFAVGSAIAPYVFDPADEAGKDQGKWAGKEYWKMQQVLGKARRKGSDKLTEEERENLRGWAQRAKTRSEQTAEMESPSGLSALDPLAQLSASAFRSEAGVANSAGFAEMGAQMLDLANGSKVTADSVKNFAASLDGATAKLNGIADAAARNGKPPAGPRNGG